MNALVKMYYAHLNSIIFIIKLKLRDGEREKQTNVRIEDKKRMRNLNFSTISVAQS